MLLIDERPEEATAWREALPGRRVRDRDRRDGAGRAGARPPSSRSSAPAGSPSRAPTRSSICDSLSRLAFAAGDVAEVKRLFGSGPQPRRRRLADRDRAPCSPTPSDEGEAERAVATTESSLIVLDPELAAAGVVPALRAGECRVSNEDQIREPRRARGGAQAALAARRPAARGRGRLLRERIEGTASNAELLRLS